MENRAVSNLEKKVRTEDVLLTEHCTFESLSLKEPVLQGLTEAEFQIPSPIQAKAIPLGRCGLDLIIQAKSGTGKTAVFTIISLELVNIETKELQVVVVAPTREIAYQIKEVMITIGKYMEGLKVGCFIGGLPIEEDIKTAKDCHIAIGAPGRLTHLLKKGHLKTSSAKLLVLDEGDKLMEKSFLTDINYICNELPSHKQMIAVSATFSAELKKFLQRYMHRSTFITPKVEIPILLGLRQFFSEITSTENILHKLKNKVRELDRLFNKISFTQCMIFCNYQSQIDSIKNFLNSFGWNAISISSSQSQTDRLKTLSKLKDFKCRILLSTDLTARGIDATNVDVVINFDVPVDADTYLHRMGRAGRYGCKGICITITSNKKDTENLQMILGTIAGTQMSIAKLPIEDELLQDLFKCDLNKLPLLYGKVNLNQVEIGSNNVTKSIFEVKNFYQKTLSESDTVPYEFERMCVEAIDENINNDHVNKPLNSEAVIVDDEQLDGNAVHFDKSITDQNNLADTSAFVDSVHTTDNLPQWTLVRETIIEDSKSKNRYRPTPSNKQNADTSALVDSVHTTDNLPQWTLVKETIIEDSASKNRYRPTPANKQNEALSNNQELYKNCIAVKNIAMFNLTQALSNEMEDLDAAGKSVNEYLKMKDVERKDNFQEMSNLFSSTDCHDILKNIVAKREEWRNHKDSKLSVEIDENSILKFGYNYLCKDERHWIDCLGDKYKPVEENSEDTEDSDEDVEEYYEENYEDMEENYEEIDEFNGEATNYVEQVIEGTNPEISNENVGNQRKKRQASEHNLNASIDQDYFDYQHYHQFYNYPIKRFLRSLAKPLDSQQSEDSFKLWLEEMSEVTKYLHHGIYWDLKYKGNQ